MSTDRLGPLVARRLLLGAALGLLGAGAMTLFTMVRATRHAAPPIVATLPDFTLEDQAGRAFTAADLDGKLWVVDFFFARCRGVCPLLAERMKEVERFTAARPTLAARTRLLSITVDPEHDRREVLTQYAAAHHIDGERWRLVTGAAAPITDVVTGGFKIAVGAPTTDPSSGDLDILHGGYLVLVDGSRHIRGYFDSDPDGVLRLEDALVALGAEGEHP